MELRDLEKLLNEMSLEEKVGQMVQIPANMLTEGGLITGPTDSIEMTEETTSLVGSILGKAGAEDLRQIQEDFMAKHPHHIPLLLMFDVINGMETIFPIPLAQGCTFSQELVEAGARMAAKEATATGLHVTFSPMLDLVRDARWGRVMESTGEDPWLNAQLGKAMVRGYQGASKLAGEKIDLRKEGNIAGCIKHFAGYGAPEGGRDYDNVELSERTFREDYLPAYHAAVEEGCVMLMTSFNTWNRIPSSGNQWLMRRVLRGEMGFEGVVISDYSAVDEMINHGIAQDSKEAAKLAILAGVDIDMVSNAYVKYLAELVREGEVPVAFIDEAVMRILKLKNDLGLFENPYKDGSVQKEKELFGCAEHRTVARKMAAASFVLLKNNAALPLKKDAGERVAFIGPYVENTEMYGSWSFPTKPELGVTIRSGVERKCAGNLFAKGCYMQDKGQNTRYNTKEEYDGQQSKRWQKEAVELAAKADKVVLCLGEHRDHSGEAGSRADISLPEEQMALVRAIRQVNPHIVSVVFSGRPLAIRELVDISEAVLMVWMPGTEGGNAIADILYGDAMPQGRLAMSMPRSVGQVPIYYNHFRTGRPNVSGNAVGFVNGYIDESVKPLYPFGYGLGYTQFDYSKVSLNTSTLLRGESTEACGKEGLVAMVTVSNIGEFPGIETVQMYLRDVKGSVVRPMKMLRGVAKVELQPGESRDVRFHITEEMLRFYNIDMEYVSEPGLCQVFIGPDSDTTNMAEFELK